MRRCDGKRSFFGATIQLVIKIHNIRARLHNIPLIFRNRSIDLSTPQHSFPRRPGQLHHRNTKQHTGHASQQIHRDCFSED